MDNSDKTRTSSHDSWVIWDLNDYLDGISLIKNEIANVELEESAKHYFFRGQASYDWNVMPGIFRNGMLAHEYDMIRPKTIQTLIKRLVSKKALSYEKQSRVFVYTPLVQEDEYIRQESNSFLKRYYNGNLSSMLASYLEDDKLSSTEIDNLRHLLSKHQK